MVELRKAGVFHDSPEIQIRLGSGEILGRYQNRLIAGRRLALCRTDLQQHRQCCENKRATDLHANLP